MTHFWEKLKSSVRWTLPVQLYHGTFPIRRKFRFSTCSMTITCRVHMFNDYTAITWYTDLQTTGAIKFFKHQLVFIYDDNDDRRFWPFRCIDVRKIWPQMYVCNMLLKRTLLLWWWWAVAADLCCGVYMLWMWCEDKEI